MMTGPPLLVSVVMLAAWRVCCTHSTPETMAPSGEKRRQVSGDWTYDLPGPCGAAVHSGIKVAGRTASLAEAGGAAPNLTQPFAVTVTVTLPVLPGAAVGAAARVLPLPVPRAPFPVVVLLDGFQCRSGWYAAWAARLASWGYAVVQYDDPLLRIVPDAIELQFFPVLLDWLERHNGAAAGFLAGQLDLGRLGVAGHSRGGKLAALHFAMRPKQVAALFMVDPVDSGPRSGYPSALPALRGQRRRYGMVGAGRTNTCNPEGSNYKQFYAAAPDGSWQATIPAAGHMSFLRASPSPVDWALRRLCPGCSPQAALPLAMPVMIAWLEQELRPSPFEKASEVEFQRWVAQQEATDDMLFSIKGGPGSTARVRANVEPVVVAPRSSNVAIKQAA